MGSIFVVYVLGSIVVFSVLGISRGFFGGVGLVIVGVGGSLVAGDGVVGR